MSVIYNQFVNDYGAEIIVVKKATKTHPMFTPDLKA